MSHKTKPTPRQSADARGPKVVRAHAGAKSVHVNTKRGRRSRFHPLDVANVPTPKGGPLPGSPGSGAAPGANGPPTTGGISPGPLGSY